MIISKENHRPAEEIVNDLKTIRDYRESPNPTLAPLVEYRRLALTPIRDIMQALTAADLNDTEYTQLIQLAVNTDKDLEQSIIRNKDEFTFLRQHLGVSQQWLADKLEVSISTIRRWEDEKSEYAPSVNAWKTLDELEKWERETALTELNRRIENLNEDTARDRRVLQILNERGRRLDFKLSIIISLHYFRNEEEYQAKIRELEPMAPAYDEYGELLNGEDMYEDELHRETLNGWSVFPQAGTYSIQNAITGIMYELVKNRGYDQSLTSLPVEVSFVEKVNSDAAYLPTVLESDFRPDDEETTPKKEAETHVAE